MTACDSNTKTGGKCRLPAGWGTDHPGQGRCKLHGGATPIRHGRYSKIQRENIRSLIEDYVADPDPLDIMPELAAARALFQDFIERYDQWREALLSWHESFSEKDSPKPRQVLDIADAYRLLASIAKIAQSEKRLSLENAVSRKSLLRIFTEQRRVIENVVPDPEQRERILDGFNSITLA